MHASTIDRSASQPYASSLFVYGRPASQATPTLRQEERAVLQSGTWFSSLSPALRDAVLQRGRVRRVNAGTVLVERGSHSASWIGVVSGALRLGSPLSDGRSFTLDILGPSQWFGDIAVVAQGANTLDAIAQVQSTLLEVSRADLRELIAQSPELRDAFLQLDCRRLRYMVQRFEELHILSLPQRLACAVQRLMQRFGRTVEGGISVELALSQGELAALSGGSRQRVNRALGQMQQMGILGCGASRLLVQDAKRLAAVAEGRLMLAGTETAS
jgi:CRP/FNR family cyclic AMP-dependent transcriptional regulator